MPHWDPDECEPPRKAEQQAAGDLGERSQIECLREKIALLEEKGRRTELLLATTGHELRDPLAALELALDLLVNGADDTDRIRDRMAPHLQQLARLANDLIEVSRVEHGKVELRKVPTDVAAMVRSAAEGIEGRIRQKEQQLVLSVPEGLYAEADPTRLGQIVSNLLSNASRCTPERGRIEVTGTREDGEIVFAVQDTGRGLRQDQLAGLFDPFVQEDASRGGLGIGLALVKELVDLHGGTVSGRSDGPGRGARFVVRVPVGDVGKATLPASPRSIRQLSRSVRVLVVDDHRDFADSLALLLDRMGAETLRAYSGADGLEKARIWHPGAMLVDLGMGDMSGYRVAREIRSSPRDAGLLLVAVTGFADAESGQRVSQAGFDHWLVKPIDPDRVHELLQKAAVTNVCWSAVGQQRSAHGAPYW